MSMRVIHLCILLLLAVLVSGSSADLVAHYRLDGNTDDSVGENDGTAFGEPAYGPGKFGQALHFDGIDDYVQIPPFKYTNEQGEFGLTFWFKVKTIPDTATNQGFPYLFNHGMTNRNNNISIYFRAAPADLRTHTRLMNPANPEDIRGGSGGPVWITDLPAADFVDGEWHMYALTSSAEEGGAIYIDGQVMNTSPAYKGDMVNLVDNINLGRRGFTGEASRYFGSPDPEDGLIDDVRICSNALTQEEVWAAMAANTAGGPRPEDQAVDLPRDVVLGWSPGQSAQTHDVYFGTSFADVNAADRTDPLSVLVSRDQVETTYDPVGLLDFGQSYFWRVDEIELDGTVHTGQVWSFTVERYSYPITAITATASSSDASDVGPDKTIDGSGLNERDQHSTQAEDMWLSGAEGSQPAWIRYAFDKTYKLHEMRVWNSNQRLESALGVGLKNVTVQYSVDGSAWTTLGDFEFAQAPGQADYAADTLVDFAGVAAKYVMLTIHSNWSEATLDQYSLSEVRFLAIPVSAQEPSPADGAVDITLAPTLSWRAGRGAQMHEIYLGTDPKALALAATVAEPQYDAQLDLGRTYYWTVVEVNEAQDVAAWEGDLWSFSTQEYLVVDDFESYNDQENAGTRIYETWIDGWDDPASNGAIVGYADPPFAEKKTIHSGQQSMPLFYDNTAAPRSEAERTFAEPQDWTAHGAGTLSLHIYGDPNNTGQMYVKIDGAKVVYDGGAADIESTQWQRWDIDLASVGVNVQAVGTLGIGVDGAAASGVLYIDDIRLYPSRSPAPPSTGPLAAWYEFEGDVNDSSGNGRDGVAHGNPVYASGRVGQAISFDGIDDYVEVAPFKYTSDSGEFSITLWFKVRDVNATDTNNGFPYLFNHGMTNRSNNVSIYLRSANRDLRTHTRLMNPADPEDVRGSGGPRFILDTTGPDTVDLLDGQWHMYALTSSAETGGTIYIDGVSVGTDPDYKGDMVNLTDTINVGRRGYVGESTRFFGSPDPDDGLIDNLALWSEALSPESIAQMYADGTY